VAGKRVHGATSIAEAVRARSAGRAAAGAVARARGKGTSVRARTKCDDNPPLWPCPKCGRAFANRNQTHTCASPRSIDSHFDGKPAEVRALFDRFAGAISELGPVTILPEKTRIAFQVRMSFAVAMPRHRWLDGHLVLARRVEHPRFRRVETFSPRNHLHAFRLRHRHEIDAEFRGWVAEAYAVGAQEHLRRKPSRSR
jgi:hypothetical protein